MKNFLEHKGYIGSAELDAESHVFVGKLLYIQDVIAYSGATVKALEAAFIEAVDEYLQICAEHGDTPDTPFKGTFNVRVGPERHRDIALMARQRGLGLNEFVCAAIDAMLVSSSRQVQHLHRHEIVVSLTGETKRVTGTTGQSLTWGNLSGTTAQH